ncbi:NAD(P)-dependent alcohol dehydrogenase [Specibacter sp. RAF43]|uniref:NAD(P)-dependent alcohol dehydrogenase n=1 Tax=Specibacter sp. RAF43 TaxID=3233057 RepID=UPI003F9AAD0D
MAKKEQHEAQGPGVGGAEPGQGLMRAIVQDRYGDVEVLHPTRINRPRILDNEVLVRVHAAGLDRGTWHMMTGRPYLLRLIFGFRKPRNPVAGLDLAGTVEAVGAAVTRFRVGEEVFGFGKGSFADYAAAREDKLARKPAGLSFEQAAVVPVSAVTALQGLRDAGRLQAGQKVLITGASGGVGSYAVQLAKAMGAEVTGVCSTAKAALVRSLGADHVIDYLREDFADGTRHYDLILDLAGNPALSRLRRALTPAGTAVVAGGEHGGQVTGMSRQLGAVALSPFVRQRLTMLAATQKAADLERVAELIDAGEVTPCLDLTFPLDRAQEAMRHLVAGKARGKVAITL